MYNVEEHDPRTTFCNASALENAMLFSIELLRRKTVGNVNHPGLLGVKRQFRPPPPPK